MYFKTTQEHEDLRAQIRAWAEREIKPIAFMLDRENQFPGEPFDASPAKPPL